MIRLPFLTKRPVRFTEAEIDLIAGKVAERLERQMTQRVSISVAEASGNIAAFVDARARRRPR